MNGPRPSGHLERLHAGWLRLLLVALLGGVWATFVPASQAQSGTVVLGEVANGTPGGSVPDGLSVTLHTFSEMEETGTYTTTVEGGRSFRFDDISLEEGQTVVARAVYDGVTYVSEFATVDQVEEEISLPVTVYETTTDPADVAIFQLHLFVNQVSERLQVGAFAVIGNTGSRTYVGSRLEAGDDDVGMARATWSATLPDGAENLRFESAQLGGRFAALDNGFADTRPIPPGEAGVEASFTYELPFREGVEIQQSFDIPVRATILVLPEGGWALEGPTIVSRGTLDTEMGAALSYSAGSLRPDQPLAFTLVPRASDASGSNGTAAGSSNGLGVGLGALVVAAVAITWIWRSSSGPVPAEVHADVAAIAALDRDFERGELSEKAYRKKRRSLKRKVQQTLSGQRR